MCTVQVLKAFNNCAIEWNRKNGSSSKREGKKLNKSSNNKNQYVIAMYRVLWCVRCHALDFCRTIALSRERSRSGPNHWERENERQKKTTLKYKCFRRRKKKNGSFHFDLGQCAPLFSKWLFVFMWFSSDYGCICIRATSTCACVWRCINESYSECLAVLLEFISKTITWNQTKQQRKKSDLSCICGLVFFPSSSHFN